MRYIFFLFTFLFSLAQVDAQTTTKRDSVNAIVIVTTTVLPDGSTTTSEAAGVDSATVKARLFALLLDEYAAIGRSADELRVQNDNANSLRGLYSQFDTFTYVNRVASVYAASIYATYKFKQDGTVKTVAFLANAQGLPIAQTGTLKGNIKMYAPSYIEVRSYFKTKAGVTVDLFLIKKGLTWVTVIDGKLITLRRQ